MTSSARLSGSHDLKPGRDCGDMLVEEAQGGDLIEMQRVPDDRCRRQHHGARKILEQLIVGQAGDVGIDRGNHEHARVHLFEIKLAQTRHILAGDVQRIEGGIGPVQIVEAHHARAHRLAPALGQGRHQVPAIVFVDALRLALDQRLENGGLVGEHLVDVLLGDASLPGNVGNRRLAVAPLVDQALGGIEDIVALEEGTGLLRSSSYAGDGQVVMAPAAAQARSCTSSISFPDYERVFADDGPLALA